jgi:hypothetical protein
MKRCLNRLTNTIKQKTEGALPSTFVVVIGHQPTSVLNLLEDDSSHSSIDPNPDANKAVGMASFVTTPP